MALFQYEGLIGDGRFIQGEIEATDEAAARARLSARSCTALTIGAEAAVAHRAPVSCAGEARRVAVLVSRRSLARFYRELCSIVASGMPLTQGLHHLVEHTPDRMLLRAVRDLEASVMQGRPMSEAMARHPRTFSPGQIGYVRAGEAGGFLKEALTELAVQSEADWSAETAAKYNPILVLVRWFLFPFLAGYIVFMGGIGSIGQPGALSGSLGRAALAAAFTALALVAGWPFLERLHRQTPFGRIAETILLHLPVVGARFRRADRIRAGAALSHALNAGVPTSIAWDLAADAPDSHDYHWRMVQQAWRIREGRPVSEAMAASGLFGPGMVQAARSGEETGNLPDMLEQTLRFDREEARLIANLTPWVIAFIAYMLYIIVGALLVLGRYEAF